MTVLLAIVRRMHGVLATIDSWLLASHYLLPSNVWRNLSSGQVRIISCATSSRSGMLGRAARRALSFEGMEEGMVAGRLGADAGTLFLICDLQQSFAQRLDMPSCVGVAQTLARTAWTLGFPTVATEQYPKGLGRLVDDLRPLLVYEEPASQLPPPPVWVQGGSVSAEQASVPTRAFVPVLEKLSFSMVSDELLEMADNSLHARAAHLGRPNDVEASQLQRAVLCGIETHVCVLNTALDLLDRGLEVQVVVDGVASQRAGDRSVALRRLEAAGAVLTTTECVMLELVTGAHNPAFKAISKLLIDHNTHRLSSLDHF
jgi:nicotinamidase-related amidase